MTTGHEAALRTAPAVARNRDAILAVLRSVLPSAGEVVEVASGTGEHAVHFAAAFPGLAWRPTDRDPDALASIAAYRAEAGLANLRAPLAFDVAAEPWPVEHADAVLAINMIHISPWRSAEGLIAGAGRLLPAGGPLVLYGPFRERDRPLVPSNVEFDASLKERDPAWGIRDLDRVSALAAAHGFGPPERHEMPANNLTIVFRRS